MVQCAWSSSAEHSCSHVRGPQGVAFSAAGGQCDTLVATRQPGHKSGRDFESNVCVMEFGGFGGGA